MTTEQTATRLVQLFTPVRLGSLTPKEAQQFGVYAASKHLIEIITPETPVDERVFLLETLSVIKIKYGEY